MPTVTNMAQLEALIMSKVSIAVAKTRDDVHEVIQAYIDNYYAEYNPKVYARLYNFADSLVKLDVKVSGTSVSAEVKIDEGYLNYTYPRGEQLTGLEVVEYAEAGTHGGWGTGARFWTEALNLMGGEEGIKGWLIAHLKEQGL